MSQEQSNAVSTYLDLPDMPDWQDWLRPVQDPEIMMSLVDLGLIYHTKMKTKDHAVTLLTLTSPGCPFGPMLIQSVKDRLLEKEGINEATVEVVWEPRWDPATMASEECKETLGIW